MNLLRARIERDGDAISCVVGEGRLPVMNGARSALAPYEGAEIAVGVRAEHIGDPRMGADGQPRLRGKVKFVELLGSERLVQLELDATSATAGALTGQAIVSARYGAHAPITAGDTTDLAVATDHLHFFDL